MKVIRSFCLVLLLGSLQVFAQDQWQEGAYNTNSGEYYSQEQWMALLPSEFDLFQSDTPMEIVLEGDFLSLIKNPNLDEYQQALMQVPINDTVVVKRIIRMKPRGAFTTGPTPATWRP